MPSLRALLGSVLMMRKRAAAIILTATGVFSAWAQIPPTARPATRPAEEPTLRGEAKLRWICKRLSLDESQTQQMEALITAYNAELAEYQKDPAEMARQLQEKSAEIQAARAAGDEARVEQLRQELRELAPEARAEKTFFERLEQVLTEPQKARLPQLRELAKDPKSASLRPFHVVQAARELGLSPEQDRRLEEVLDTFRKNQMVDRPKEFSAMEERIEQLVRDVRAVLTAAQAAKFDDKITTLRFSAPAPVPMSLPAPATQPAQPAGTP